MSTVKKHENLELLAGGRMVSIYSLETSEPLRALIGNGYWDRFGTTGLRRHDRIMVTASIFAAEPELGWFVVVENERTDRRDGHVLVRSLNGHG